MKELVNLTLQFSDQLVLILILILILMFPLPRSQAPCGMSNQQHGISAPACTVHGGYEFLLCPLKILDGPLNIHCICTGSKLRQRGL